MATPSSQVESAISEGLPIVALETAVLTSGLPKEPWQTSYGEAPDCIDTSLPTNQALANAVTNRVLENGALPAWIGVVDGVFKVGLSENEIEGLCKSTSSNKVTLGTLAHDMNDGKSAGTTVATTLLGCKLASKEQPIRVFATGGIGGMHQNWNSRLDVSADLTALATTPTCVVSSGAKSILDLQATVEILETLGVPTLGLNCNTFPPFIEESSNDDPIVFCVKSAQEVAEICNSHWNTLGLYSAVLATVPAPRDVALMRGSLKTILRELEDEWLNMKLHPRTRTPFLLEAIASKTQGQSLRANVKLLCNNAKVASQIAVAIAG